MCQLFTTDFRLNDDTFNLRASTSHALTSAELIRSCFLRVSVRTITYMHACMLHVVSDRSSKSDIIIPPKTTLHYYTSHHKKRKKKKRERGEDESSSFFNSRNIKQIDHKVTSCIDICNKQLIQLQNGTSRRKSTSYAQ